MKGFKTFYNNPYYKEGMEYIRWDESSETLVANEISYKKVKKFGVLTLDPIEVRKKGDPVAKTTDYYSFGDFGEFDGYAYYNNFYSTYYTDVYQYYDGYTTYFYPPDYVYYFTPDTPENVYVANSGLSGYTSKMLIPHTILYYSEEVDSQEYDYRFAYYYGYDHGQVFNYDSSDYLSWNSTFLDNEVISYDTWASEFDVFSEEYKSFTTWINTDEAFSEYDNWAGWNSMFGRWFFLPENPLDFNYELVVIDQFAGEEYWVGGYQGYRSDTFTYLYIKKGEE